MKAKSEKPDTRFRACKKGCGERFWCEKPGTCPTCKVVLSQIAADGKAARKARASLANVGAAYTRGQGVSRLLRSWRNGKAA